MEESKERIPSENALLKEYREAMESQRSNTSIAYSWMTNISLVLSSGLFIYGTRVKVLSKFIPLMIIAFGLAFVWWGMTETFVFYIKQRMKRIHEIEKILNLKLMSGAAEEIEKKGWKAILIKAGFYVRFFIFIYVLAWILLLILNFEF